MTFDTDSTADSSTGDPPPDRAVSFIVRRDLPYAEGVALQRRLLAEMAADPARPGVIILAEHNPVITRGRSGDGSSLLVRPEQLAAAGIEYHAAGRGGDVTFHGPGQWTVYPILRLAWFGKDLHRYLRLLEEAAIRFLAYYGVEGTRRPGLTGVWVGAGKVAAIGVAVSRWITWHGLAVNIHPDLANFTRYMLPCGIAPDQGGVASLDGLTGRRHDMDEVAADLRRALLETFQINPT